MIVGFTPSQSEEINSLDKGFSGNHAVNDLKNELAKISLFVYLVYPAEADLHEQNMSVIKKNPRTSANELVTAIERFIPLLRKQKGEEEAANLLASIAQKMVAQEVGSDEFSESIRAIIDSFDGDYELKAYTLKESDNKSWSEADEMAVISSRIYALARRFK
ncbi:MAG: hypothetical protein OYH77_08700 [Pseudomonadota bacterium]|nr:hypothetical protein [Pseudomonadota bacterium]